MECCFDHINNQALGQMSGVKEIAMATRESKICRVGRVVCLADNCGHCVSLIGIGEKKRLLSRPLRRWPAYVKDVMGTTGEKRLRTERLGTALLNVPQWKPEQSKCFEGRPGALC